MTISVKNKGPSLPASVLLRSRRRGLRHQEGGKVAVLSGRHGRRRSCRRTRLAVVKG